MCGCRWPLNAWLHARFGQHLTDSVQGVRDSLRDSVAFESAKSATFTAAAAVSSTAVVAGSTAAAAVSSASAFFEEVVAEDVVNTGARVRRSTTEDVPVTVREPAVQTQPCNPKLVSSTCTDVDGTTSGRASEDCVAKSPSSRRCGKIPLVRGNTVVHPVSSRSGTGLWGVDFSCVPLCQRKTGTTQHDLVQHPFQDLDVDRCLFGGGVRKVEPLEARRRQGIAPLPVTLPEAENVLDEVEVHEECEEWM